MAPPHSRERLKLIGTLLSALLLAAIFLSPSPAQPSFAFELEEDVALGEEVLFKIRVKNEGLRPMKVVFGGCPVAFFVERPDGAEVWNPFKLYRDPTTGHVAARGCVLLTKSVLLLPGMEVLFSEAWAQVDNDGLQVLPGLYLVSAMVFLWDDGEGHTKALKLGPKLLKVEGPKA